MLDTPADRKRILRNSLLLYARMLVVMLVTLYTSRVVLHALGVVDFGVYNVVAGVVALLSCATGPMSATISRYIVVTLGRGGGGELRRVFSSALMAQALITLLVVAVAETAGLWLVLNKLVIPPERMTAALWVYQFAVFSFAVLLLTLPYSSLIVARERMGVYAYISFAETGAKLAIVLCLTFSSADKLMLYGVLYMLQQVGVRLLYVRYCRRRFPESLTAPRWEGKRLRSMFAYSLWCSVGYLAEAGNTQGVNVLLNLFFGPAVNAARAVAVQVQTAVRQFCDSFQYALSPQISKSQAAGDYAYMHKLVLYGTKYSFFITLAVVLPLYANAPYILGLWLREVPEHTAAFVRLTLLVSLVESMKDPLLTALHATGRIRREQVAEGVALLAALPLSYAALRWGGVRAETVYGIWLSVEAFTQGVRLRLALPRIELPFSRYLHAALLPVSAVAAVSFTACAVIPEAGGFPAFLLSTFSLFLVVLLSVAFLGLGRAERGAIWGRLRALLKRRQGQGGQNGASAKP